VDTTKVIFIVLLLTSCVTDETSLQKEYYQAIENLTDHNRQSALRINKTLFEAEGNGAAILAFKSIDTIGETDVKKINFDSRNQEVWIASSQYDGQLLSIDIGQIFHNEFVKIQVKDSTINSTYREWYKTDKVLKLNHNDTLTNELNLGLDSQNIRLSKMTNFKYGEEIYGKIQITTEPFINKENHTSKIRKQFEILLKFKVRKPVSEWHNGMFE